jgi:DNA mismatch endonuclease (patch repair protein)
MKAPTASSENARSTMRANRRISGLERRLRTALWAAGARGYRVQSPLPGRPDILFPVERLVVLIQGCFWHVCPTCRLPMPKANAGFWASKLARNADRDHEAEERLRSTGWLVVIVWEHEIRADLEGVVRSLIALRSDRRAVLSANGSTHPLPTST